MKLYLIRHAESANNAIYAATGSYMGRSSDPEITETGHQQAQKLAKQLASANGEPYRGMEPSSQRFDLTHLYCSLMTRTILTANYAAEACGLALTALPHTFERGGIYDLHEDGTETALPGRPRSYFTERWPALGLPDSAIEAGWYRRPVETDEVFVTRVEESYADIMRRHAQSDDHVALVAHGDFIDQFINLVMGVARFEENYSSAWEANWAFNNTSISRIDFADGSRTVVYLNRIDHLSAELITW